MGYKIVHVQEAPPSQVFTYPKPCDSHHGLRVLHKDQSITCAFLTPYTGKEVILLYVWAKLSHDGIASRNLCIGCSDANIHYFLCSLCAEETYVDWI